MKQITKALAFAALAATALVSCKKELEEPVVTPAAEGIKVAILAEASDTKTELDGATTVIWSAGDKVGFINGEANVNVQSDEAVIDSDNRATFTGTVESAGTYYAYYPYFNDASYAPSAEGVTVRVSNEQHPSLTSFDPAADLLVSEAFEVGAEGSYSTDPTVVRFKRLGAFIKLTVVDGTTGAKLNGEYATSVAVQGENNLVGRVKVSGTEGLINSGSGYKKVTANYEADTFALTTAGQAAYFGVLPQTFAQNSKLIVTITTKTGKYNISKTLVMPKDIELAAGQILPIKVTLTNEDAKSTSVSVSRVWGLYSTSSAAWNEYYGGTANTDRNVALDEDYIYVCETVANTPKIWAISRTDNSSVTLVSTEGILTASFWPTACPRVLKNTDPSINGGKDVLVVASMSNAQDALYIYAYLDGITNKPTPVQLGGYITGRRLGDTFTHWGTLQKGMFFFKDMGAANMMSYKIANTAGFDWATVKSQYATDGTITKVAAQGNIVGPAAGVGGYFPYPNDKNNGFFGIRDNVQAYMFSFTTDAWNASGLVDDAVSTSTGSGYFLNSTSAVYFEVGAYKYVVYTRQVSGSAGGVMFLRGDSTSSYADIINARKAGGAASAAFSIAADSDDVTTTNAKSSGNGGFDLAAYKVGEDVYVAAIKQNVGLSLFKVSAE